MLENYFFDKHGMDQEEAFQRQKAVEAVLEIIKANTSHTPMHVTINALKNDLNAAADAIQEALKK